MFLLGAAGVYTFYSNDGYFFYLCASGGGIGILLFCAAAWQYFKSRFFSIVCE